VILAAASGAGSPGALLDAERFKGTSILRCCLETLIWRAMEISTASYKAFSTSSSSASVRIDALDSWDWCCFGGAVCWDDAMGSATRFVGGGGGGPDGFLRIDRGCGGVDTEAGDSDNWSVTFGMLGSDGDSFRWNLEMRRSRRSGVVSASAGNGSSLEGVETEVVLFLDCAGTLYMAGVGKLTTAAGVVLDRLREESLGVGPLPAEA
jgi:hypothetical protein